VSNLQFPVDIKTLAHAHLHLPHPIAGVLCILDWWIELVAPRTAVAVSVAVVVAEQIVAAGLFAAPYFERLVYGCEEFFFVLWY